MLSAGNRCSDLCPEGYFGQDCYQACRCQNDNYLCHPTLGCVCQPSFHGPNCSLVVWRDDGDRAAVGGGAASEPGGLAGLLASLTALILLCSALALTFYYRHRFQSLKTQLSHVRYSPGAASPARRPEGELVELNLFLIGRVRSAAPFRQPGVRHLPAGPGRHPAQQRPPAQHNTEEREPEPGAGGPGRAGAAPQQPGLLRGG